MNFRYPIFLDLTGKKCLVSGAGSEIAGKLKRLVDAGARVVYVNATAEPAIERLALSGSIVWHARDFQPRDLAGCFLVISSQKDNLEVFRLAEEQGILCNSVDDPAHSRFSFGSVLRRGDLTIAISTNGSAPALAVRLRERFEHELGPEYDDLLGLLNAIRPEIARRVPDFQARRSFWYRVIDSDVLKLLRSGEREAAVQLLGNLIEEASEREQPEPRAGIRPER
ncbi:MAG: bifunctional precorrin-2 dehydrogenase/sirohydrochlorin ferrochelatase [Acidobacteriaceae bacterium]|nr:bifunctional precorrin-2 dehydrogenase/sirohydrochlorin ferrochelatase [Acidobacteriaceae bacterium]